MISAGVDGRRILFLVAHPYLAKSRANRAIVNAIQDLPGLTLRVLYDLYPDFMISVSEEQEMLLSHDLVVVQHPLYWYSMPPLMKMWVDEVFESGWAYGRGGDKLRGKNFLLSVTAGGPEHAYEEKGTNRFALDVFLKPWEQTAHLCHMKWHAPKVIFAAIGATPKQIHDHALGLRQSLEHFLKTGAVR